MDLYIYVPRKYEVPRDEIEKLLEAVLGDSGEVTGGGSGAFGQNIDVEIFDDEKVPTLLSEIRRAFVDFGAPAETELSLDGESFLLIERPRRV